MQTYTATNASRIPAAVVMRGAANLPQNAEPQGTRRAIARGHEVFSEGDSCTAVYKVVSGTVRTMKLLPDGRRQIHAFHLAGDVFALESGMTHRFSAEAVDNAVVIAYRRSCLANAAFGPQMMSWMQTSLERATDHMVVLGRKNAMEKVASFLLDLAGRTAARDRVELPMQRNDIADYLGLTIETVSRTISQMIRQRLIRLLDTHTIVLADRAALQQLGS
jgi:CRP/FNR family nitrogen fixation transcriptional regulator